MVKVDVKDVEEFQKLATDKNFCYLWLLGKENGSLLHFAYDIHHQAGESQYTSREELNYVLLSRDKDWSSALHNEDGIETGFIDLNRLVELMGKTGFTACFFENWREGKMSFLSAEATPEEFRPFVLLHEAVEIGLQGVAESGIQDISEHYDDPQERAAFLQRERRGAEAYAHGKACEQELHAVAEQGEEFFIRYANWLWEGNYPDNPDNTYDQYYPGFMNISTELSPVERTFEFYFFLDLGLCEPEDPSYLIFLDRIDGLFPMDWMKKYVEVVKADLIRRNQAWYDQYVSRSQ